jgi:hypothetical protein
MSYDVFISHSGKDHTAVYEVASFLKKNGIKCFTDDDNLPPGAIFSEVIATAIKESSVFLLIFSSNSDLSPDVRREVGLAININKPIIPFRLEKVEPDKLGFLLSGISWMDGFPPPLQKHLPKLLETIRPYLADNTPTGKIRPGVWYPISLDKVDDWVRARINICDSGKELVAKSWIYRKNRYTGKYERSLK